MALAAIAWRQVEPPPPPEAAPLTAGDDSDWPRASAGTAELEAKVRQLQMEAASAAARSRDEGRREGETAARQRLEAPLKEALGRLAQQIRDMAQVRRRLRREAEEDLVKLALEIARRVLRRELTADPGAILGLVKAALERVETREVVRVRAHPEDARTLETCFADLGLPDRIEVLADQGLERGAVVLETTRGVLDASVETQLQEIERGFTDLMRRNS